MSSLFEFKKLLFFFLRLLFGILGELSIKSSEISDCDDRKVSLSIFRLPFGLRCRDCEFLFSSFRGIAFTDFLLVTPGFSLVVCFKSGALLFFCFLLGS
ncbi:hypothetical protein C1645_762121 [Glomus cerebriforme]|uniref:Uncharacterized protein n=1 Tax=Glomus cerebriforme TaxID=658196 RepID=A0A397T6W3_9GLOM|nr:hypothetical protein C1645_762121 [Glomus cerebriforme]